MGSFHGRYVYYGINRSKKVSLEEQFSPDVAIIPRISLPPTSSFKRRTILLRPLSIGYFIRWIAQPLSSPHRTIWSTKWALHQGMSGINCIVTVSFARSQYVKLIPSKSFADVGYLISKDLICSLRIQYHASGRWSDGSEANIAVMVECCEFVSTASFSWSILYTIAASTVSFSWIISLSQDSSKINLRCSQLLTLCSSLSFLV